MRQLLIGFVMLCFALGVIAGEDFYPEDGNWVAKAKPPIVVAHDDSKQQECFSWMRQLKKMWFDIHANGIEAVMAAHPPGDEQISREEALKFGVEVEAVDAAHAQEWIERKWNECLSSQVASRIDGPPQSTKGEQDGNERRRAEDAAGDGGDRGGDAKIQR
jgi:hypothetical protein